ncbi:hypothetical protein S83_055029 [Arachis hypogaea]
MPPKSYILDPSSKLPNGKDGLHLDGPSNLRASYLSGHDIAGDAILASIGYTWKCRDLFYEDILKNNSDGSENGSLLQIMNRTLTIFGSRLLRHWVQGISPIMQSDHDFCSSSCCI